MSFRELVEGTLAEGNEYSFLRKHGFKKSGTLTDGGVVHTHPEHGAVIINKHGEWHHVPHGSSREDGFEGTTGNTLKNHISRLNESDLVEGDVNYAKMHTQTNPKYATGTKWRKSSAAVKAKPDDVGAGELGAHGGGSGHVSVKATMNQRDKLADRQEINALGHKAFAIKQTRLPRTSVRKPLPEGLAEIASGRRELVEASGGHYHSLATAAINKATGFSPRHEEYHKWMAVHHKAMRAHYEQNGDRRLADSHDAVGEHHADHVSDDDFHAGESHHWRGF